MESTNLNDLYDYGYMIYQNDNYFKFSIDSVLLAEFVDLKKNQKNILDLCSGNAPVPMILSKKYGNSINITGIELQTEIYNLGIKSIDYNNIGNITFLNEDVKNILNIYPQNRFDVITCNPPYFKKYDEKNINDNKIKAIARHELTISLEDIVFVSSKLLNNQGYLYMVHRPERIAEIIQLLIKYNFGLKRLQTVHNDKKSNACLVLVEAIYNGKDYVIINSPLFLKEHSTYQEIFRK